MWFSFEERYSRGAWLQIQSPHCPDRVYLTAYANDFIERYFRTLRKTLFRKLRKRSLKISQETLDDFAFLWNHCRQVNTTIGKTSAQMLGLDFPAKMLERFKVEKQSVGGWTFWHIQGVHGLLHAYLRRETLLNQELHGQQKIAWKCYWTAG